VIIVQVLCDCYVIMLLLVHH